MRASGSQGPQIPQTNVVKNQVYSQRRGNTSLSAATQSRTTEKRRNPRPLSFTSPSTHSPSSSRPPFNDTNPTSKSVCASPTGNGYVPVNKLTSANGGSTSFVAAKSPLDKNSLPAFYSEQSLVARSISQEDQKSSLENLISVISSVLKSSNETEVHCPVIQPSLQPIDPLKSYRNINHVKELNDKLAHLESENFKLKLKLFYLEEERNKGGYSVESNQNINLQVELQEVKSDLAKRNELLKESLLYLNNFDKDFDKRTQSPATGKSSETCLRDKTTSEDESLVSQGNCTTIAEDSIGTSNIESQVRDKDWLKSSLNRLMNEALTITPNLTNLIENTKKTFNVALANVQKTVESEDQVNLDMDIDIKNKRIEALESELKKYQELDCSIPTRDTPISHEVEQELRSLHQAVIEKDRLYQEAIKEKCSILKESEERCKSIISVAQERSEEAQRLNAQLLEMRNEYESAKKLVEDSQNSVAVLKKEKDEMKKAMEKEVEEKNRILSEAEVLDQMQNEQSQELAKLKTRLSNLQELHQRALDEAHDKECNLKETQQKLIDAQNQLEIMRNQSKVVQKGMSSIIWDASSIHNHSALDISQNVMEQSTIGEFLKSFQGTETNHLLLNHIYELEKFLHKLLTCENPGELLSQGSFTPVYVDSLRKALVGVDGTLDASQSGISLMLLERTYEALPQSMINADLLEIGKAETESDGATRDRDMSDMSVNSFTKHIDKGDQDVGDSLNGTLFARRLPPEKGEKQGHVEYARDIALRDISSDTSSSNVSSKYRTSDVKLPLPRRRWSSPFPHLPDPSGCFKKNSEPCSGTDSCPLSLLSDDSLPRDANVGTYNISVSETVALPSSSQRPLVLTIPNAQGEKLDSAKFTSFPSRNLRKFESNNGNNKNNKCYACGQSTAITLPACHHHSDWMEIDKCPETVNCVSNNVSHSAVMPYNHNFSSESDIWSEPDRTVSMKRMGLDSKAITIKSNGLEGEGCNNGIFFEPKKIAKRCCHPMSNGCKLQAICNCFNDSSRNCANTLCQHQHRKCDCASTSTTNTDSADPNNSKTGMCYLSRLQLHCQHRCGNYFHRSGCSAAPKNQEACVGNSKELEPLVLRIENTVEALSRELAKFQNENPHLILRLLDMLKESNGNSLPSLVEGQILSSFEILGGKMDLLGNRMNDVNIAARTLAEYFNLQSSPKSDTVKTTYAKEILSPLNISTRSKNMSPLLERSLSGPIGAQGRIEPPSYHSIKRSLDNEIDPRQSEVPVDDNLSTLRDCYNQLVESLCSSLDWMKSVNDSEINEAIEQQEIKNLLNNSYTMNKGISSANYSDELRKLNQMLPDWVHLNRSLFQTLVKSLRGKNQVLKVHEEQIATLNRTLETKFKELKQVQDWNLRLQNELDNEKLALGSTLQKLSSVQDAFDAASEEVKSKMDTNAKMWDENKILKSSIESRVSDSGALKELCHKLQEELKLKQTEKDDLKVELNKAYSEIQNFRTEADSQRKVLENHLKREYENNVTEFKNQIDNLIQLRQKIQLEKDEMFTELKFMRKESVKHKEMESCWRTSYETLEKQLEEKTNKLSNLISSKEKEVLKRTNLEENLRETLKLKISMENDCQLLGERLNEIQRKNREMASQLKLTKDLVKCHEIEKETLRQSLKDLELRVKPKATVQAESLGIAQSDNKEEIHVIYGKTQDQVENKSVLENELDNYKRNEYSMKQALHHEKEKVERYKKNLAYAKVLLKQKGVGLKSSSLSGLSIEALDEVGDVTKDSGKSSKSHFTTETSTQTCEIQKAMQSFSVQHESGEPNLENIIQGLLEETNSLKADLEKTTKANKELSDKIKEYECYSDDAKVLQDDFVERPSTGDHFIPSGSLAHQPGNTQPQLDWTLTNLVNQNSSPGNLAQMYMERDVLSSSESLLHSRVIEQLGTKVTPRAFAGFNCISNEVPVRDIDSDMVCGLRNMAPDFQSSNEEIQTIISGVGGVNARRSPRSVYSSPDLGIESDPNRERGSSGSPLLDNNQLNKRNISTQSATKAAISAFKQDHPSVTPINIIAPTGQDSNLVVICPLGELVLLTKEVEESVAILEGIKARLQDRILTLTQRTNGSSPAKTLEYSTLKEVDSSCYKLQVCLCRSIALINIFSAEPKKLDASHTNKRDNVQPEMSLNTDAKYRQELESLRLLYNEQSEKLKEALATLDFYQKRKENVEKAISRQLSKTKRVLRKAKGNLLEEKKVVDSPEATGPDVSVANIKTVASTPMVKPNK